MALNTSGQAVGCAQSGNPLTSDAAVWTYTVSGGSMSAQTLTDIQVYGLAGNSPSGAAAAYPSVQSSVALAVNSSGQVLVAASNSIQSTSLSLLQNGVTATFLYNIGTETFTSLGGLQIYDDQAVTLRGTQFGGHAEAINDSGEVVGRIALTNGTYDAALWQNGTVTDLNKLYAGILPAGFTLNNATAIDDQGDIAGYGTDAADHTNQAFVIYAPTPGDANLDGRVDVNDLTIVLSHFGQTGATWAQGEFTGDGKVDVNDLTIVLSHFGQTVGASAGAPAAVPEPCALALLAAGLLASAGWVKVAQLLVGLRKPINRDSALCGPTGRVAATEAPPEFRFARPTLPGLYRSVRGVLGGILLSVDALWVDPRGGKRDWGWGILRTEEFWD